MSTGRFRQSPRLPLTRDHIRYRTSLTRPISGARRRDNHARNAEARRSAAAGTGLSLGNRSRSERSAEHSPPIARFPGCGGCDHGGVAASVEPTVDDARELVDRSVAVVEALRALAKPRKDVKKALRGKIGDRDGWICRICREPVDPELAYRQRTPQEAREHAQHLARYTARDLHIVIEWVGQDGGRANSALRWFSAAHSESGLPEGALRSSSRNFLNIMISVAQARAEHNRRTASAEHLHPVSVGGGNEMVNLAIAHRGCNTAVNPAAENADLLDAPRLAAEFLERLHRGSTNGEAQAQRLDRVCAALANCGAPVPDHGDLVVGFPAALAVVHVAFADMWAARRGCRIHLSLLRWDADRGTAEGGARLRELTSAYGRVPWRGHTAQWWQARRAELPELSAAFVEFMSTWDFELELDDEEDVPAQVLRALSRHR